MATENPYPSKIQRISDQIIRITWSDEHQADYSVLYLRKSCPCAGCSSQARSKSLPVIPANAPDKLDIVKVVPMGNYAIGFHFSDGHATGIYSYDYLRGICPCKDCTRNNELG